jgi:FKBP-type peptidyl-prolyl cis-trans isomerase FkpA
MRHPFVASFRRCRLCAHALSLLIATLAASGAPALAQVPTATAPTNTSKTDATVTELRKTDVKTGTGTEAVRGRAVIVHYTGWLYDPAAAAGKGTKFDSSLDRKIPFGFILGAGRVIRGWDEGVAGMKVGGQRTLIVPPHLGYGERGAGGVIPPNATLLFDIELLEVKT